ncbi:MAG: hypothetical protein M1825_000355 [Sarcosagium campestre]|nr:MAG: hypothetical protein M1825_000355 [Sarcosagium campestre]
MANTTTPNPSTTPPDPPTTITGTTSEISPIETELLEEYTRLLNNLNTLSSQLNDMASLPSAEMMDGLRALERKTSLVFTLLKASVYSIVLQQQIWAGEDGDDAGGDALGGDRDGEEE